MLDASQTKKNVIYIGDSIDPSGNPLIQISIGYITGCFRMPNLLKFHISEIALR